MAGSVLLTITSHFDNASSAAIDPIIGAVQQVMSACDVKGKSSHMHHPSRMLHALHSCDLTVVATCQGWTIA